MVILPNFRSTASNFPFFNVLCCNSTEMSVEILRKKDFNQSDSKLNNFRSHFCSYCIRLSVFPMCYLVTQGGGSVILKRKLESPKFKNAGAAPNLPNSPGLCGPTCPFLISGILFSFLKI